VAFAGRCFIEEIPRCINNPNFWIDPLGLTKAPSTLPESPGIYILTNGNECYVGCSGLGAQGMNTRVSSTDHIKAQALLNKPGTKVQYVRVNLGTATSTSDRNNILRYYEAREHAKSQQRGLTMLNDDRCQNPAKKAKAEKLIKQHGASASSRRTTCK